MIGNGADTLGETDMIETIELELPVYWASYLINGDSSGLEDGEQEQIDAFLAYEVPDYQCVAVSDDSWFAHSNDANDIGGDVATYTFHKFNQEE